MPSNAKSIPLDKRLIFALDVPTNTQAIELIQQLGDSVQFYKVGLELFMHGQYFQLVEYLIEQGKEVFVDLKFFDVPKTVERAIARLSECGASFATVHGNDAILRGAIAGKSNETKLKILAVTVLTSLDQGDLSDLGFSCQVEDLVLSRAKRAIQIGCDGVISSGLEAPALRDSLGDKFLIVSPGIRPVFNDELQERSDDQKRVVDVAKAFSNGADHIVVGRPIRDADDPKQMALAIQQQIKQVFADQ